MVDHRDKTIVADWHVYIIDVNQTGLRRAKRRFWGMKRIYYTGISHDFGKRLGDYIFRRKGGFVNQTFPGAIRRPVYVEHFHGSEIDAMRRERQIKRMGRDQKESLIKSSLNALVGYKPLKHMIIRKKDGSGQEVLYVR